MEGLTLGFIVVVIFLVLLFLGTRIAMAGLVAGLIGVTFTFGWKAGVPLLIRQVFDNSSDYGLTVIPMFVFMGFLAYQSGLGAEIYAAAKAWMGHYRAGLAMATTIGCAAFGAVTGSATAAAIMFAKLAIPEMRKYGYQTRLMVGCVAGSSTLATLIPPSVPIVIYGILTEQSIGRLLIGGILPGIVTAIMTCIMMYLMALRNPGLAPPGPKFAFPQKMATLRPLWALAVIVIISIGGLYVGVFTPTEAGALGGFAMIIVTLLRRRLTGKVMGDSLLETARMAGITFIILIGVRTFMTALVATGVTAWLAKSILGIGGSPYVILVLCILLLFILGMFLSGMGAMLTGIPFIYPIIQSLGFDPIWFGIIVVKTVELGLESPPNCPVVFVTCRIADEPVEQGMLGIIPFIFIDLAATLVLIIFPQIVTFLPSRM